MNQPAPLTTAEHAQLIEQGAPAENLDRLSLAEADLVARMVGIRAPRDTENTPAKLSRNAKREAAFERRANRC